MYNIIIIDVRELIYLYENLFFVIRLPIDYVHLEVKISAWSL